MATSFLCSREESGSAPVTRGAEAGAVALGPIWGRPMRSDAQAAASSARPDAAARRARRKPMDGVAARGRVNGRTDIVRIGSVTAMVDDRPLKVLGCITGTGEACACG